MEFVDDYYPTRLEKPGKRFERLDPVVYSRGAERRSGPLTETQLLEYDANGFLVFDEFFPEWQTNAFLEEMKAYSRDETFKQREEVITEAGASDIRSIFSIHKVSERFDQLTRDPRLLGIAAQLLDSDVYIHQSRMNAKPGFSGGGFNWHSDFETWHSEDGMPRMRCFSVSILLTPNNDHNGPLQLVPGSHRWFIPTQGRTPQNNWKRSLKQQSIGVPAEEDLRTMIDAGGITSVKGKPGTMVIFECNTLHASGNNLSPWPRSNLFFVYNSVQNRLNAPYCGRKPRPAFLAARSSQDCAGLMASEQQRSPRQANG